MSVTVQVHINWFPRSSGAEGEITLDSSGPSTALTLLEHLEVPPDSVLVVRGQTPIPLDTQLVDGETLRIILTVSGG